MTRAIEVVAKERVVLDKEARKLIGNVAPDVTDVIVVRCKPGEEMDFKTVVDDAEISIFMDQTVRFDCQPITQRCELPELAKVKLTDEYGIMVIGSVDGGDGLDDAYEVCKEERADFESESEERLRKVKAMLEEVDARVKMARMLKDEYADRRSMEILRETYKNMGFAEDHIEELLMHARTKKKRNEEKIKETQEQLDKEFGNRPLVRPPPVRRTGNPVPTPSQPLRV